MKYIILYLILFFFSIVGFSQSDSSRILKFYYGGYGDTIVAILTVEVLTLDSITNEFKPLYNSTIQIFNESGIERAFELKENHRQDIGFGPGWYSVEVSAIGYQKLIISDFKSRPDQYSYARIYLASGEGEVNNSSNPIPDPIPRNSTDTTYYADGTLKSIYKWKNDTLLLKMNWYETGQLSYNMTKLNDSTELIFSYYPNGQLSFTTLWNKSLTIGFRTDYFDNGVLKEEKFNTEKGQLYWTKKDSLGNFIIRDGNSIKSYWKNHKKPEIFGYYKNGKKHGRWIWNYSDGTKFKRYKYKKGDLLLYKFYDQNGKLYSRSKYKNGKERTKHFN